MALTQSVTRLFGPVAYPGGLAFAAIGGLAFAAIGGLAFAAIGGLAFAAIGMFSTSLMPGIETFSLPILLFITPMFLFSGTFFSPQNQPPWARGLA